MVRSHYFVNTIEHLFVGWVLTPAEVMCLALGLNEVTCTWMMELASMSMQLSHNTAL